MNPWTTEELTLLRSLWGEIEPTHLAERLGRSERAVRVKASRMGLSAPAALSLDDAALIVDLLRERELAKRTVRNLSDAAIARKFDTRPSVVRRLRMTLQED